MMGGTRLPTNPQVAMARRPRPEDAASHITVRYCLLRELDDDIIYDVIITYYIQQY